MSTRPIMRHYEAGYTFRWAKGDAFIAVKRGHVIEGQAHVILPNRRTDVADRPYDDPGNDRHTWVDHIPVDRSGWDAKTPLKTAAKWWLAERLGARNGM